ncbi:MAG: hypothetical protein ACOYNL_04740 [Rickettsiales bacterium]
MTIIVTETNEYRKNQETLKAAAKIDPSIISAQDLKTLKAAQVIIQKELKECGSNAKDPNACNLSEKEKEKMPKVNEILKNAIEKKDFTGLKEALKDLRDYTNHNEKATGTAHRANMAEGRGDRSGRE